MQAQFVQLYVCCDAQDCQIVCEANIEIDWSIEISLFGRRMEPYSRVRIPPLSTNIFKHLDYGHRGATVRLRDFCGTTSGTPGSTLLLHSTATEASYPRCP
jgi:hypothetical protein